jgi:hypothetical protein
MIFVTADLTIGASATFGGVSSMLHTSSDRTAKFEYPFPKQVVFRALRAAVGRIWGMRVRSCDELACRLDIATGISALAWGETVSISVFGNGEQAAVVSVQSAAKVALGSVNRQNQKNIRDILNRTSAVLKEHGVKWRQELGLAEAPASVADELMKLAQLRDKGLLKEAEFEAQKARLLRQGQ